MLKSKYNFLFSHSNFLSLPLIKKKKITLLSFLCLSPNTFLLSPLSHYSSLSPISAQSLLMTLATVEDWRLKVTTVLAWRWVVFGFCLSFLMGRFGGFVVVMGLPLWVMGCFWLLVLGWFQSFGGSISVVALGLNWWLRLGF